VKPGKPFYVSTAHDPIAIDRTLETFEGVVASLA